MPMVTTSIARLIKETRRRRVFGVLGLYIVGAWVLLQAADLAFPGLGVPESAIRYVWIGAILGLPVAVVFGWRFDITTRGIRRTQTVLEETTTLSLRTPDYILLLVLSTVTIAMIILLTQRIVATQGMLEPFDSVVESHEFDPPEYSIAILPFDNLSSDPEQEYFVAGMHDALITELALISSLTVISRTSTLRYEKTKLTIPEIARELNVSMIVEGSVFKSGDQVRIQVQLIGSYPERHLLAQTYDRNLSRVLELQAEVTRDIAEKIKLTLTPQEHTRLADARIVDPETYTLWLKGNFYLTKSDEESFRKALTLYQEATQRDPEYAPAYAGQARAYMALGGWRGSVSPRDVIQLAKKAAERALRLDPSDAEAHLALGGIRYKLDWDWAGADRAFRQGLTLKPNDTLGRIEYANFLTAMGRFKESVEIGRRTLELEPLLPMAYAELAFSLVLLKGHDDEVLELIREGREIDPSSQESHAVSMLLYQMRGDFEEALAQLTHMERIRQDWSPNTMGIIGQAYASAGWDVEARALLSHLLERRAMEFVSACALAYIYIGLGEDDEALRWLEVAYDEHDVSLVWLKVMWIYDRLRSDQRFQSIFDRMDFPEP